jgi:hypothetical protein
MTIASEPSLPERSPILQIAITLFLGIPMTLALVAGLVLYCAYECMKFAFSRNQTRVSNEETFTRSLAQFASIHKPPVAVQPQELKEAQKDLTTDRN